MRDLMVGLVMFGWMPFVLFKPYIGILLWDWLSHMNPHKQGYGFALTFPFLDLVAMLTIGGLLINKNKKSLPGHPVVVAMFLYFAWVIVTTLLAFDTTRAIPKLIHSYKVVLFAFLTIIVMQSPNRLKAFVWVLVASMAYIAIKGGLYTIATGGSGHVEGAGGMMEDNNQLAVAMAMTFPLALYLYKHPPLPILKWPMAFLAMMTVVSVVGTQSRGGFAALAATSFMLLLKTKRKFTVLAVAIPLVVLGVTFAPDSWKNRIESSEKTTEDGSFRGRVVMWKFSANLADDNPIEGGGYDVFYVPRARELYLTPGERGRAPHSIYFEVLAEHGYVGFVLFLTMLFTGWYSAGTARKGLAPYNETRWLSDLCASAQLAYVAYAAGGLTVNIATFDYFYDLLAITVLCHVIGAKLLAGKVTDYSGGPGRAEVVQRASKKWSPPKPVQARAHSTSQAG